MPHFVDTNVVVYSLLGGPKAERALAVIGGATISVQVLNEVANVALRKLGYNSRQLTEVVAEIRSQVMTVQPITEPVHDLARELVSRYRLGFYDSALLAAALLADCETFYSEDMQNGLLIEERLTIRNPFN